MTTALATTMPASATTTRPPLNPINIDLEMHALTIEESSTFDPWAHGLGYEAWAACSCDNPDGYGEGAVCGFFRTPGAAEDWHADHLAKVWEKMPPALRDAHRRESSESPFFHLFDVGECRTCGYGAIAANDGSCIVCEGGRVLFERN